eukprot:14393_1
MTTQVKTTQVEIIPKYSINVDFEGKTFIHKIYKDKNSWNEQIFNDLKSAISQQFDLHITSFNLYGDEEVSIENIDDIIEAFDELDREDDLREHDAKTIPSVKMFVKIKSKHIKDIIQKPDISVIHDSDKVISLGYRLKLLQECIAYNKYKYEFSDEKCELEDMKYELDYLLKDLKEIGLVEG